MKIATILLLTSLSSSNADTSFLRASISNDGDGDALRCLGECADEDIYNGKKKHPTKKKVFTKATDCASACLPATQRNEATISCATKCFKKQASDVEKAVDKAIDKEIKDCEKKCDEDDKDCEKKCDRKYKSGSRSKSVSKAVIVVIVTTPVLCSPSAANANIVSFALTSITSAKRRYSRWLTQPRSVSPSASYPAMMLTSWNSWTMRTLRTSNSRLGIRPRRRAPLPHPQRRAPLPHPPKKSSTTTSSKDESKCVGRYRNREAECRASSKCVWNDSRERCEDEGTMSRTTSSSDYDQFLELAEKNLGYDCPDDFPADFCEEIKKLLQKLREVSGGDGDGIIRPKTVTAVN
eukprot:scaffold10372_cov109-Skeletonema_dohrnii-CCMP3373.AAC.1